MPEEIACDESGYEGEKLIDTTTDVFAHASIRLPIDMAANCVAELRARIKSPAVEYKATHLLRERNRGALLWFLGPTGPLVGAADVFLVEKSFAIITLLCQIAGEPALAPAIYRAGQAQHAAPVWADFLRASNDVIRAKPGYIAGFDEATTRLAQCVDDLVDAVARLVAARPRLEQHRAGLSWVDPLLAALQAAVARWGSDEPVLVVHDR